MAYPLVKKMGQETFDLFLATEKQKFSFEIFLFYFKKVVEMNRGSFESGAYPYFKRETEREVKRLIKKYNAQPKKFVLTSVRMPTLQPKSRYEL
ncbi:MAG: hypothetical protein PHH40_00395 [Candidatus Moranbacteria bacterium]|nr:hypothetical protein [Candidatus Moranbacteria bacterium]MDD3964771.1 hypothetical protein [Candidatus Moranbacteria bacterium]